MRLSPPNEPRQINPKRPPNPENHINRPRRIIPFTETPNHQAGE